MAALGLSLLIFGFLALLGYAILSPLMADEEPIYRLLLAPVVGTAVAMLLVFIPSQLGAPVERFGMPLAIALALVAILMIWHTGRRVPGRDLTFFLLLTVVALLATGWPMLRFGFDWVSYCNDDMANYCMGTERLLHYGYFAPPNAQALAGTDYTQLMWYLHVLHRPGSELFMAMMSAATGVRTLRLFMPVVMAFTLCQISAAAAMTWAAGRSRLATWMTWGLMSASALVALGTLYQLVAQVIGLAIAAGLVSVLLRPMQREAIRNRIRKGALIGLLGAGLLLAYTEAVPFVALAYGLYLAATLRTDWLAWRRVGGVVVLGAVIALVLLNRFLPISTIYLLRQAHGAAPEDPATTLFPYYMLPSGPVFFWGIYAIGRMLPSEGLMSAYILVSILLCVAAGWVVVRSLRLRQAPAYVCAVMFALWVWLFFRHSGFGMYKLAMYFQPFILSAVALGWVSMWRSRVVQVVPLVALGLASVSSHRFYTEASLGTQRVFSEIPAASSTHIVRAYADLLKANPARPLELDTSNVTLAKFQMIESIGRPAMFPSKNFLGNLTGGYVFAPAVGREKAEQAAEVADAFNGSFVPRAFDLHPEGGNWPDRYDPFLIVHEGDESQSKGTNASSANPTLFIGTTGLQVVFNRWRDPETSAGDFRAGGLDAFQNHLIFTASELGQPHFMGGAKHIAMDQLEPDIVFHGRTMASIGRYLLFQVVNPSARSRLKIDLTDTFAGDGENRLPPASVVGASRVRFPFEGRGSARIFSEPLAPQVIDGHAFVALDMGTEGTFFNYVPGGLMRLWGREVRLDRRQLVAFARDISLVSEDEYHAFDGPAVIERFPDDLGAPTLEYSGIYEDGYVSEQMFAGLTQPMNVRRLVVEGIVPRVDDPAFKVDLVLSVDGKELLRRTLGLGEFALDAEVPPATSSHNRHKVELTFSKMQRLPGGDRRPVGAQLTRLGYAIGPSSVTWQGGDPARHGVHYYGVYPDGWVDANATIHVAQPPGVTHLVLQFMIPRIDDGGFTTDLRVKVDGKQVAQRMAGVGEFEVDADVPPSDRSDRTIDLSFSKLQTLPAPDTRRVGARLEWIGFAPAAPAR